MRRPSLLAIAVALALAVTALWWQLAERRARAEAARAAILDIRLRAMADSLVGLRSDYQGVRRTTEAGLGPEEIARLRDLGLGDPVHDLIADLARHPELIPFPGVLGSHMIFIQSECAVLSGEWVYAYFEDGHVSGRAVIEYEVRPGGRIAWKLLAARKD